MSDNNDWFEGPGWQDDWEPIDPGGAAVVATWAAVREDMGIGASAPVFCALPGGVEAIKAGF